MVGPMEDMEDLVGQVTVTDISRIAIMKKLAYFKSYPLFVIGRRRRRDIR
jgi:hypothetical protein